MLRRWWIFLLWWWVGGGGRGLGRLRGLLGCVGLVRGGGERVVVEVVSVVLMLVLLLVVVVALWLLWMRCVAVVEAQVFVSWWQVELMAVPSELSELVVLAVPAVQTLTVQATLGQTEMDRQEQVEHLCRSVHCLLENSRPKDGYLPRMMVVLTPKMHLVEQSSDRQQLLCFCRREPSLLASLLLRSRRLRPWV